MKVMWFYEHRDNVENYNLFHETQPPIYKYNTQISLLIDNFLRLREKVISDIIHHSSDCLAWLTVRG